MKRLVIIFSLATMLFLLGTNGFAAQRMVLFELHTSTTCPPCVAANATLNNLMTEYEEDLAIIRYHAWWPAPGNDPFYLANVAENTARIDYYNVNAVPDGFCDGASTGSHTGWESTIQNHLQVDSPLTISIGAPAPNEFVASITAEEDIDATDLRAHFVIIESNIEYTGTNGDPEHHQVMRDMLPDANGHSFSISQGETVDLSATYSLDDEWVTENLELVVFVQNHTTREIYQAAKISMAANISITEHTVEETSGDGDNRFESGESGEVVISVSALSALGDMTNVSAELMADSPAIEIDNGSVSFGDMESGETATNADNPFTFNILPNVPHVAHFTVLVTADGYENQVSFEMIIGRPPLVIDDDGGDELEMFFTDVLDGDGLFYEMWSSDQATPANFFSDYPLVIWFTGDAGNGLSADETAQLAAFLEAGNNLILTGQDIAELLPAGDMFLSDYLGVEYVDNAASVMVEGVSEDPYFGDFQVLVSSGSGGANNQTSMDIISLTAGSAAIPVMQYPSGLGTAAVRYSDPTHGYNVVYFGFGLESIYGVGNFASLEDIIDACDAFFTDATVAVEEPEAPRILATRLDQNYPNPFNPATSIRYALAEAGHVSLKVYDTAGRLVKTLVDAHQTPNRYDMTWDGTDNAQQPVASGLYFYQLQTDDTRDVRRMLLLK